MSEKNSQIRNYIQEMIVSNLAQGTGTQVSEVLNQFIENINVTKIGVSSVAGLIITLVLLLRQIEGALNRVWIVKKERNIFTRFVYFWTYMTLGAFIGSLAIGFLSGFELSNLIPMDSNFEVSAPHFVSYKTLIGYITSYLFFVTLYKMVPNCKVSFLEASIGAGVASILFQTASKIFGIYVKMFAHNEAIYGALTALPLFLTWLYICWLVILFGAIIAWRSQIGFPDIDTAKIITSNNKATRNLLFNTRIQSLTPFIVLFEIHKKFISGERKGVYKKDLDKMLNIPKAWIGDALKTLEELEFIKASRSQKEKNRDNEFIKEYFPSLPANRLNLDDIYTELLKPTSTVLNNIKNQDSHEYGDALAAINRISPQERSKTTLEDIFKLL